MQSPTYCSNWPFRNPKSHASLSEWCKGCSYSRARQLYKGKVPLPSFLQKKMYGTIPVQTFAFHFNLESNTKNE